jgi:hypothetical protein
MTHIALSTQRHDARFEVVQGLAGDLAGTTWAEGHEKAEGISELLPTFAARQGERKAGREAATGALPVAGEFLFASVLHGYLEERPEVRHW